MLLMGYGYTPDTDLTNSFMSDKKPNMIQSVNDLTIKLKMKFDKIHFGKWVAIKDKKILMSNTDLKILMAEVKENDKSENINYMLVPLA